MLPTKEQAEALLLDAESCNPGKWGDHSRVAARCAKAIASHCSDMDADKAYILGLLHDIGRKFGVRHLGHVSDGYSYMMEKGCDEAARVCMTHSFHDCSTKGYIGKFDTTKEETELINTVPAGIQTDDYDKLIQLCDCLANADGVVDMEERMADVKRRYGSYPQEKRDANMALKRYFEEKAGENIYDMIHDEEHKEKTLRVLAMLAHHFNEKNVVWAVGGSLLLYFKGITECFHDIDIMTEEKDIDTVKEILSALGTMTPPHKSGQYKTRHFLEFTVQGVDVDVMAGFVIVKDEKEYDCSLTKAQIAERVQVNGESIPLQALDDWRTYYDLMGRKEKVFMIDNKDKGGNNNG